MKTVLAFIIGMKPAVTSKGFCHLFSHFSHIFICMHSKFTFGKWYFLHWSCQFNTSLTAGEALSPWISGMLLRRLISNYNFLSSILEESSGSVSCSVTPNHQAYLSAIAICDNLIILTLAKAVLIHTFNKIWWFFLVVIIYKVLHLSSRQACAHSIAS